MKDDSDRVEILFASGNRHKTAEIQALLGDHFLVRDLSGRPSGSAPDETGQTYEANALIKAGSAITTSPIPILADDSGLEVDALGGAPGINTARFAGPCATDEQNRAKLLAELQGQPNRAARFVCVLALIAPGLDPQIFRGEIEGRISTSESGDGGFGYDPIFIPSGHSVSFAEISTELKNRISHRAVAIRKLLLSNSL